VEKKFMEKYYSVFKPIDTSRLDNIDFKTSNPEINTFSDYSGVSKPSGTSITFDYTPEETQEAKSTESTASTSTTATEAPTESTVIDYGRDTRKETKIDNDLVATNNNPKDYSKHKGYDVFTKAFDEAVAENPELEKRRAFFTELAKAESGFDHTIQNKQGAPAYGYFQFMQGSANGRSWNNIGQYAGVSLEEFRNNPKLQIIAANKLADSFLKNMTEEDRTRAKRAGYSDNALIAGAWLGGNGGLSKALRGIDSDDKNWSKDGKTGTTVLTRMKQFNY
jgi:hypothetical protein